MVAADAGDRRSSRRKAALLAGVALALVALLAPGSAKASESHLVTIVGPNSPAPGADVVDLASLSYGGLIEALGEGGDVTVALPIPGFGTLADVPMDLVVDERSVALVAGGAHQIADHIASLRPVLFAVWDDPDDPDGAPDLALALEAIGATLEDLHPAWAGLPDVDDVVAFTEGVITLVPEPTTFDWTALPAEVTDLYARLGEEPGLVIEDVATLLGDLDLDEMPALALIAKFLGFDDSDVEDALTLAGSMAETAAFLFDAADVDPGGLSLQGPIEVDTGRLPAWFKATIDEVLGEEVLPEIRLRLEPGDGGVLVALAEVVGSLTVDTGGTENTFDYAIHLDQVDGDERTLEIELSASEFDEPFGLGWMDLDEVELHLRYRDQSPADHEFAARFEADLPLGDPGSPPRLRIEVADDPAHTRGSATVDGDIPVPELLAWLAQSDDVDAGALGIVGLAGARVTGIELSADSDGPVLGLLATVEDVFGTLRVTLLLGIDAGQDPATVLTAVLVDSEECGGGGECVHLDQVIPLPGGGLSVDLELPAVRFLHLSPDEAEFRTARLGERAREFLATFTDEGDGTEDPATLTSTADPDEGTISRPGGLHLLVDVPLDGLAPVFGALGLDPQSDTVRLEGRAGFSLADLDTGEPLQLEDLRLEARHAGFTRATPADGFPEWLSVPETGQWQLFVEFARGAAGDGSDDSLALGASVDGIRFDELPGAELAFEATFSGNPAAIPSERSWELRARGSLAQPWVQPFGISWLTIDDAFASLTIRETAGVVTVEAELGGTVMIGEHGLSVTVRLSTAGASLTVELVGDLSIGDVLGVFVPSGSDLWTWVPDALAETSLLGGSALEVGVVFPGDGVLDAGVTVDVVAGVSVPLFGGDPIQFSTLLHASFPFGGDPSFLAGIRPEGELTLFGLLGLEPPMVGEEPLDITLVSDDAAFAFLFAATAPGSTIDPRQMSEVAQGWFAPVLLPGGPDDVAELSTGVAALGTMALPDALGDMMSGLGMQQRVQLFGAVPLDPDDLGDLRVGLAMVADQALLPEFLESGSLTLGLSLSPGDLEIQLSLGGELVVLARQGVDPDLRVALAGLGLDLQAAEEVTDPPPTGFECPRGGRLAPVTVPDGSVDGRQASFCHDRIRLRVDGELGLTPSAVTVTLRGGLLVLNEDSAGQAYGWSPMGLEDLQINQLTAEVELGFTFATRAFSIKIGGQGSITVFGKTAAGGIRGGIAVTPPPPPPPIVAPLFDGFWVAVPQGISSDDLVDLYDALVPGSEASDDIRDWLTSLPPVALQDLFLSVGLADVPSLCINQGFALRAELNVGQDPAGGEPTHLATCDSSTGEVDLGTPTSCLDRREQGCVARVDIDLSLDGIVIEGELIEFDVSPPGLDHPILSFDDSVLVLRLTADEALLRVEGGLEIIGPGDEVWADGRVRLLATPTQLDAYGRLEVFGYGALFELRAGLGGDGLIDLLLGRIDPSLELRIVLAAPGGFGADPDFGAVLTGAIGELMDVIDQAGRFLEERLGQFDTLDDADLVALFLALPGEAAAEFDFELPSLVKLALVITNSVYGILTDAAGDDGPPITLGAVLNTSVPFVGSPCDWLRSGFDHELFDAYAASPYSGEVPEGDCDVAEVQAWIRAMTRVALDGLQAFEGFAVGALDQVLDLAASGGSPPFALECAELDARLSLVGGTSFSSRLAMTIFGHPLDLGLSFDFDPAELDASAGDLFERLWERLTSSGQEPPCEGIGDGLAELLELEATPVVGVSVDPSTVDEGGVVTATVSFDRDLDAPRTVEIDWGDPTHANGGPTELVELAAGQRSKQVTHLYRDDVPSDRSSAIYTVRVQDLGEHGGAASAAVTVRNVRPSITAIELPARVQEGEQLSLTVRWTDPGVLDTHTVLVSWGDGTDDEVGEADIVDLAGGERQATLAHTYADDDPTGTPEDMELVQVLVADDDRGVRGAVRSLVVENVAPEVCLAFDEAAIDLTTAPVGCPQDPVTTVDEGPGEEPWPETGHVTVHGGFHDPGLPDDHVVVIDWGYEGEGFEPVVLGDPSLVALPESFPGDEHFPFTAAEYEALAEQDLPTFPRGSRTFGAAQTYGDTGQFTIRAWVLDDDLGVGLAEAVVTVDNVDPEVAIDTDSADAVVVMADGPADDGVLDTPTFLTRIGQAVTMTASASDPGSDDLRFTWSWGDGLQTIADHLLGLVADTKPSPEVAPRSGVDDTQSHAWTAPCLYDVGLVVEDDDGGTGSDDTWVVVTGTDHRVRNAGWWDSQFDFSRRNRNRNDLSAETLTCYADIARHMSQVFDTHRGTATFEAVREVLLRPSMDADDDKLDRQLLTTWLNLAHGSLGWFDPVATPEGSMALLDAMRRAEAIWIEPDSTDPNIARAQRIAWKDALERING